VTELDTYWNIPTERADLLRDAADRLLGARRVILTTHVNADGDGAGSEAAVAAWLEARGVRATIMNPTPFPEQFRFLLHRSDVVVEWQGGVGAQVLRDADLHLVLDTSEANRVGPLAGAVAWESTLIIDHHPPGATAVGSGVQDPSAAATGELVHDLIRLSGGPWPRSAVEGIYVAIVTDTGSFRYANTSPRAHLITADLLARGVIPEEIYRRLYGRVPRRRLELLRDALGTLEAEPHSALAWLTVTDAMIRKYSASSEDLDGLVEHARSIEGTEVAMLFRETANGETKISFRSNGDVDVNRIAREFGGGGHVKAAGALVASPPAQVIPRVLAAARAAAVGAERAG
jgi:phosphoesterase RecJ-like protein